MFPIHQLFSEEIISALGWTMINILWQGFLIAFILGLVLKLLKNFSSFLRYYLALISLFLIIGISVYNFVAHYELTANNEEVVSNTILEPVRAMNTEAIVLNKTDHFSYKEEIMHFFTTIDRYFPFFINVWMIGMLVFLIKLSFGLLFIQRLKVETTPFNDIQWKNRFKTLEKILSIDKKISYLESNLVKIPMVLGYFKPVILVPAGMLAGLPVNQIEAIIAHELAHIKRHDYLINILQSIIELIFFFHPAVWYISSVVRAERENCCDDIALTVCDGSITYAKALVSVQEIVPGKVYSAVAFSGQKKQLLNRIKRMIMKPEIKSNKSDKIIASLIILIGIIVITITANFKAESSTPKMMVTNESESYLPFNPELKTAKIINPSIIQKTASFLNDTSKVVKRKTIIDHDSDIDIEGNTIIKTYRDDNGKKKEMKFKLKNGVISELYIDGKKIPESEYPKYQPEVDKTIAELKEAKEDIHEAIKEIEEIDFEKIKREVEESMKDVQIDMEEVQKEIEESLKEAKNIDVEAILKEVQLEMEKIDYDGMMKEVQKSIEEIKHIDMEEIEREMQEVRKQMENIDYEKLRAEIEKNRQEIISQVDMQKIEEEMKKVQEEISKIDVEKIKFEMERTFKDVDKTKMIEEMEKELEKLEGLELEKK